MKSQVNFDALGGGGSTAEWIEATLSNDNKTASAEWDYDADSIVIVLRNSANNVKALYILDVTTGYVKACSQGDVWYYTQAFSSIFTNVTLQKRRIQFTWSVAMYKAYILPASNSIYSGL